MPKDIFLLSARIDKIDVTCALPVRDRPDVLAYDARSRLAYIA